MEPMVAQLAQSQPDHMVVLTDLETADDAATVKARITQNHTSLIFVAIKALEAWFLADTDAMQRWLNNQHFFEPFPEQTPGMPWERLKEIAKQYEARGPGASKVIFAKNFCNKHNYKISNSANHVKCPSAKVFCDALEGLTP
jgi:hypothetical protein